MSVRPLYLLIEETGRELRSRLLLALHAARAGYSSVLAPQWLVWETLGEIPRGLLIFKGNSTVQARNMANAKAAGHLVATIEEEALGLCDAAQIARCYDPSVAELCDLFLLQGPFQRDCLAPLLGTPGRLRVCGNPRIDLLSSRFDARNSQEATGIKDTLGDFLLINTNFSTVNPRDLDACAVLETCLNAGWYDPKIPEDIEIFFSEAEREKADLENLINLVHVLIEEGFRHPIVIRPHPAENLEIWERAFAAHANVHIQPGGDLTAWISAATLLLHTSCTTGMEAFVLGTPAISLMSPKIEWTNIITSNLVNPTFKDVAEAARAIGAIFDGGSLSDFNRPSHAAELRRHVSIDPERTSSARIVDACAQLLSQRKTKPGDSTTFEAFARASTTDPSIDLAALDPKAARAAMHKLGSVMGFDRIPRIEEIASGVLLCHPLDENHSSAGRHAS